MQFSPLLKNTDCAPCRKEERERGRERTTQNTPSLLKWQSHKLHNSNFLPLFGKTHLADSALTTLTALSRSQSEKMMSGDLPPSSRDTFLTLLRAALFMMVWPTPVDPVNPTFRTSMWSVKP